jgi:hypothetical protein
MAFKGKLSQRNSTTLVIRIPKSLFKRINKAVKTLDDKTPHGRVTQASILRMWIANGVDEVERDG